MTIEADIESYLAKRVKATGGEVRKVVFPGRRHAPDRLAGWPQAGESWWPRPARHSLVELKRPGEKPRAGQLREHDRLRAIGFEVVVIDSFEAVDAFVDERIV